QPLIDKLEIILVAPGVVILYLVAQGMAIEATWLADAPQLDLATIASPGAKGRVDIDQVHQPSKAGCQQVRQGGPVIAVKEQPAPGVAGRPIAPALVFEGGRMGRGDELHLLGGEDAGELRLVLVGPGESEGGGAG